MKTLRKLRKEKGLTQQKLGKLLGVTSQAIANFECGKRFGQLKFIKAYADILGISLDEFAEIVENITP